MGLQSKKVICKGMLNIANEIYMVFIYRRYENIVQITNNGKLRDKKKRICVNSWIEKIGYTEGFLKLVLLNTFF